MKIAFSILAFLPFYCAGQNLFTLVPPEKSGINFQNTLTESSTQNVLAYEYFYNGGGVAVGDLNNDGLPDIVLTSNQGQPRIYINKGNFVFDDISKQSKVRADGWKTGVTLADVNGDGWLDIYICRSGNGPEDSRRNLLFINQKNGTFKEEAKQYGIDDAGNSTQAVFFDYDNDGDLDLFLLNHSIRRLNNFNVAEMKATRDPSAGDKLYRNDGDGHFTDVSAKAGIIGNSICFGLGASVADFNGDGWPDLYVSNDYDEDDYLYINQKDGTFKESLRDYFGHTSKSTMGCDVADINDDGMSDLFTLDMLPEDNKRQKILVGPDRYNHFQMLLNSGYYYQYMRNMLHLGSKNNNKIQYSEIGQLAGISNTDWSWSALFCDFDLDGWQDLFVTNGYWRDYTNMDFIKYTKPAEMLKSLEQGKKPDMYELVKKMPSTELKNYLFKNLGNLTFKNVGKEWGMDLPSFSNGAAYGDFDNDGDWDLVVNNINQPAFIWQNHAEDLKNNYIKFRFKGAGKNPFGIGTKVIVSADDGFKQLQELELVHGFQSSVEPCLIFGLGKRKSVNITVIWQNGRSQTLTEQAVNRTIVLEEDKATDTIPKDVSPHPFFSEEKNDSLFKHIEDDYNDFNREPLLPRQYSKEGPALAKGDVNGDSLIDFYVGGAKGHAGVIYLNKGNGKFNEKKIPAFENDSNYEDLAAVFADFNHDGNLDLYVVSGGNEDSFQDRIYWNDGKGNFSYKPGVLPSTTSTGGTVVAFDFNHDGFPDIFRGGRVLTGSYPYPPASYLFENDHGVFKDVTPDFMKNIGMVSTAEVADINHDGIPDLVLAGEFMPVTILWGQKDAPYFTKEKMLQIPNSTGWWNCLKIEDINNDGYPDIVAGNQGLNNQMKPTIEEPVTVDAEDIDNSGTIDAIISYFIQGKSYPMASRDELLAQVPTLKTKFPTYESYSDATVKDIFPPDKFAKAIHLKAEEFRSGVFMNDNGTFHFRPFPIEAQISPVRDFLIDDFNHDGLKDILLTGNDYAERVQSGRDDAGKGLLLLQSKAGNFLPVTDSGFQTDKDARKIIRIDNSIIVANNNDWLQIFRIN